VRLLNLQSSKDSNRDKVFKNSPSRNFKRANPEGEDITPLEEELDSIPEEELYKIAVGYDPEDNPHPLFDYAFHLAQLLKGKVIFVHALEEIVETARVQEEEKTILQKLTQILNNYTRYRVPMEIKILYGKSIDTFRKLVEEFNIDLFGFYFYKKLFGRSFSQELLEYLPTNLLVVKENIPFRRIKKILVPVDFSESSFKQKEFIERLLTYSPYRLKIDFLHIVEEENTDPSKEEEIRYLFKELFGTHERLILLNGDPEEVIIEMLQEKEYDLVVLGRTGKGLNQEGGKVSKRVVKEAPCPVVLV
jgi:nucleotide-binding universal stress UspA family protein